MRGRRWYSGKGGSPDLRAVGHWTVPTGEVGVYAEVLLVEERGAGALYQGPLVRRPDPPHGATPIAPGDDRYDGTADPAFVRALFELVTRGGAADGGSVAVTGEPVGHPVGRYRSSRVLRGEQSNTSIIVDTEDEAGAAGSPVIVKLFR